MRIIPFHKYDSWSVFLGGKRISNPTSLIAVNERIIGQKPFRTRDGVIDRRGMECDCDVWAYDLTLKSEGRSYILSDNYCALLKLKFIDIAVSLFASYNLTRTIYIYGIFWMKLLNYKYSYPIYAIYVNTYHRYHNLTYLFKKNNPKKFVNSLQQFISF